MKERSKMKLKVGKKIDAYHDGKTSPSRLSIAEVIDVVKITDLSKKYLRMWKKAIVEDFDEALMGGLVHYISGPQRFWDWNCDECIFAKFLDNKESERDPSMFARRPGGGWYGVNWNYMLDVKGKTRKEVMDTWKKSAQEMGQRMEWNDKLHMYEYFDIKTGKKVE